MISAGSGFDGAWECDNGLKSDPLGARDLKVSFREEERGLRAVWPLLVSAGAGRKVDREVQGA